MHRPSLFCWFSIPAPFSFVNCFLLIFFCVLLYLFLFFRQYYPLYSKGTEGGVLMQNNRENNQKNNQKDQNQQNEQRNQNERNQKENRK